MTGIIRALWSLGLETVSSCQDFGEGTAGQRAAIPHPSRYGGDAFIAYYTGYAWLKMPVPDAKRLAAMLMETEFRDRLTQRWTPGSWRMHVPLVFDGHHAIDLDDAAQIHFPRQQIPQLAATLASQEPGTLVISDWSLAAQHNVSFTTAGTAKRALAADGIITKNTQRNRWEVAPKAPART
jgi:hypothetical protein